MRIRLGALALAASVTLASAAIGEGTGQTDWHGRITETNAAYEAVRYTLSDAVIRGSAHARFAANNDLVDFGGAIHQAVPGGWEVHVYLNFEPVGAATPQGDIETLVFVNMLGEAESFTWIDDPTPIDDPTVPLGGRTVDDQWEYDALVAALNDSQVISCAADRLDVGVWWFDTDAATLNTWPTHRKIEITLEFLNPDESTPARGLRDIVVKVDVEEDLSASSVLQVQCK